MTNITTEIKIISAAKIEVAETSYIGNDFIETYERFFAAAKTLDNSVLGLQFESVEKNTRIMAFSNSKIDKDDFDWIFEHNMKTFYSIPDNQKLRSDKFTYILTTNHSNISSNCHCDINLFSTLQKNNITIQLYALSRKRRVDTMVVIQSSEELPLRIRINLSVAFGGSEIKKITEKNEMNFIDSKTAISGFGILTEMLADQLRVEKEKKQKDEGLIEALELSVRAYNCLKRYGVKTIEELSAIGDDELSKIKNLGSKCIIEIHKKLEEYYKERLRFNNTPIADYYGFDNIEDEELLDDDELFEAEELFDGDEILLEDEPEKKIEKSGVEKLNELIGLSRAKEQVKRIVALAKLQQDMKDNNKNTIPITLNMQFAGNPGTAKTTVARIMAQILFEAGLIKNKDIIEVGRADLVAKYVGQTADKVKNLFSNAKGRLLFIDEAYSLVDEWENSYGDEAINTIVQEMENNREDIIVIFAGYPKKMEEFFNRNVGLKSRVPFCIKFDDYSTDEMIQISKLEADRRGFTICDDAIEKLNKIYTDAQNDTQSGNGRCCRNVIENAIMSYAARVYGDDADVNKNYVLTDDDFIYNPKPKMKEVRHIGFQC